MKRIGVWTLIFLIAVMVFGHISPGFAQTQKDAPISDEQTADPPYQGTVYIDPDIITEVDPTSYQGLANAGNHKRTVFDRRTGLWDTVNVYVFDARYDGGLHIEALVNPEFGSVYAAREAAERYAHMVGQLPTDLRAGVKTLTIHKGDYRLGGGNHDILIHTDYAEKLMQKGFLEEALIHEGAHSSLDADHATASEWLEAQQADGNFISTYARDHPTREDVAESFSAYFVVRYRPYRVPKSTVQKIERSIPNRLAYFDSLELDMYPTWSQPVYGAGSHGLGTTLSYVVAGTTDVLAEIEYLEYAMHNGRWVIVLFNDPPVPEGDTCHGMTHEYWDLETGNWVACLRDGKLLGELKPHNGFFRFPMTVGNEWSQEMNWVDYVHSDYSSNAPFQHTYAVEECGIEVKVPAGEFTTCRVRFVEASYPDIAPQIRWYDPDLDLVIKTNVDGVVYELWDYDLVEPPDHVAVPNMLEISVFGDGEIYVKGADGGQLDCAEAARCQAVFNQGDEIVLTAEPDSDWTHDGWVGCDQQDEPDECTVFMDGDRLVSVTFLSADSLEFDDAVVVLRDDQFQGLIDYALDTGRVVFDAATDGASRWAVGTILLAAAELADGLTLARRVTGIQVAGNRIEFSTERASLEETFRSGSFTRQGSFEAVRIPIDVNFGGVSAGGEIAFPVDYHLAVTFSPFQYRLIVNTRPSASIGLEISDSVTVSKRKELSSRKLGTFFIPTPFPIPPIPVVLTLKPFVEGAVQASVSVEVGSEIQVSATAGVHYKDGTPNPIFEANVDPMYWVGSGTDAGLSWNAEIRVGGELHFELWGVAGPFVGVVPYYGITAECGDDIAQTYKGWRLMVGGDLTEIGGERLAVPAYDSSRIPQSPIPLGRGDLEDIDMLDRSCDAVATIAANSSSVMEGLPAIFTVTFDPVPASDIVLHYTVTQTGDYVSATNIGATTLDVPAGTASVVLTVPTEDNIRDEEDGSVQVWLRDGMGYHTGLDKAMDIVTVADSDDELSVPRAWVMPGGPVTEGTAATFTVMFDPVPASDITLHYTVQRGGYKGGVSASNIGAKAIDIPRGTPSVVLTVPTEDDNQYQGGSRVFLRLDPGMGYHTEWPLVSVVVEDDEFLCEEITRISEYEETSDLEGVETVITHTVTTTRIVGWYFDHPECEHRPHLGVSCYTSITHTDPDYRYSANFCPEVHTSCTSAYTAGSGIIIRTCPPYIIQELE